MSKPNEQDAWRALERYKQLVDDLPCECDDYQGYKCNIHSHRRIAQRGLLGLTRTIQLREEER